LIDGIILGMGFARFLVSKQIERFSKAPGQCITPKRGIKQNP
jgi:hypothetical protein